MIRFVDIRGQDTGYRFSFWDTVTDKFVCISTEYAWCVWSDIVDIADETIDLVRYKNLCPDWVYDDKEKE